MNRTATLKLKVQIRECRVPLYSSTRPQPGINLRVAAGESHHGPDADKAHSLKALIFPSRTSHTRFFPKKHSFSYSYLLVGIPVGWRGSFRSLLSADLDSLQRDGLRRKRAWFSIEGADYLHRGYDARGLHGKLESYLKTQNEDSRAYPFAYLVTAPRFLGYSFNPVSFWYLYDEKRSLKAMILEVNNTFDERRMYFLKGCHQDELSERVNNQGLTLKTGDLDKVHDADEANKEYHGEKAKKFTDSWSKDFHVSPFNSRKGSYGLSAYDPLSQGKINNTITMSSSKGHPKLVAKIFSTGNSIDPLHMGTLDIMKFVAVWWWVGFVTFPRIVREAAKLFFRRKLHVWYRPEVMRDSLGRKKTREERLRHSAPVAGRTTLTTTRNIESCFRAFLKSAIEESEMQVPVKYTAAMSSTSETFFPLQLRDSPRTPFEHSSKEAVELKIATPLFYSNVVRHSHISEFITSSLLTLPPNAQTFYTSNPQALLDLFDTRPRPLGLKNSLQQQSAVKTSLRWRFLRWLRNVFPRTHNTIVSPHRPTVKVQDIRPFPLSPIDVFAQQSQDIEMANRYRKAVIKLLISDIAVFGQPILLDALDYAIRIALCYILVKTIGAAVSQIAGAGIMMNVGTLHDRAALVKLVLGCSGVHLWWAFKKMF
ncbi:hypothetical protein G7Y79_00003g009690 [Physcia stellaris]|nr:hypothetical protein G7Y79_00003g009690 [Physcia stellaris]